MSETFEVIYREDVEEDLSALDLPVRRRLMDAVETRLSVSPVLYGKPLGGPLAGLRRIRVGDYRIGYQIKGRNVVIWAVQHRKIVYSILTRRWGSA